MAFILYNPNPANHYAGDCVVRAICKLTNSDWDSVFMDLSMTAFKMKEMPSTNHVWGAYLYSKGFARKVIPNTCPDCYSIREFAFDHPIGKFAVATGEHVAAVIDGNYYDAWDSGNEVPVYYWEKEI